MASSVYVKVAGQLNSDNGKYRKHMGCLTKSSKETEGSFHYTKANITLKVKTVKSKPNPATPIHKPFKLINTRRLCL